MANSRPLRTPSPSARLDQVDRLELWRRWKASDCNGCWSGCCTFPVEMSVHDLIRLGHATEDEASASLARLGRRLLDEGVIQSYRAASQIFVLAQKPSRDCIYLGADRLCTVYDRRPEVCRRFPKIGPKPGSCPGHVRKPTPKGALK
jgi:Fe-S-cluster containining protein